MEGLALAAVAFLLLWHRRRRLMMARDRRPANGGVAGSPGAVEMMETDEPSGSSGAAEPSELPEIHCVGESVAGPEDVKVKLHEVVVASSDATPGSVQTPPHPDVRLDARPGHEVTLLPTVLGKGGFGRVVEGMYEGQPVAVKLILDDSLEAWGLPAAVEYHTWACVSKRVTPGSKESREAVLSELSASLAQEVAVLSRCRHPNIMTLIAACLQPPRLCLVMERMETSLDKLLYGRPGVLLPMEQVLSIALDVARGLEYLHPTVLHRDLKPE
ncbi:hypothetical protein GPECTOR_20g512 [Gonium pectorale]|uniref:Protein kinase domain-containing protein n=1 Tax=Gonium pectorale TaxID=33097 RepID=A0A150GIW9_GONPE|nr:hypothetical protein GPECTOR_20g512 [Gonium pectorale]|eukprot:KXZ49655.1 hypothetical protein GPECTOR_20g512 [Gonium pectorale]